MDAIGSKHLAARCLIALALACCGLRAAHAAEPCSLATPPPTTWGQRVAAAACAEHRTWYSPFIDERGRLATMRISEAENARLQDNPISAWRRVVDYWKASGLMSLANGRPGAYECNVAVDVWPGSAACRSFVIDTPWSAVFVSFAYVRAGVPGFIPSASHFDFARGAIQNGGNSPFRFADPDVERPAPGDLMCFTRGLSTPMGSAAFRKYLERKGTPLAMHCDIVVAANAGGDGKLYTVGGNVLQGVTMRTLQLNQQGLIWALPRETGTPVDCRPSASAACNFDRQDWVVLLKLEPKASAPPPTTPQCCTVCTLPMPAGMKRCPVAGIEPAHPQPLPTTAPAEPAPSPEAPTETKRP